MSDGIVLCGDALEMLRLIEDESVQCCVTSPPYYGLRDYGNQNQIGIESDPYTYIDNLVTVFEEIKRVLRTDGTLWLNIGDSYAANRSYQVPSTKGGPKHSPAQSLSSNNCVPDGMKPKDLMGIPWMLALQLRKNGWYLRNDIIWYKPNAMPGSYKDRCTSSHEHLFLLTKSARYYFDSDAISEPCIHAGTEVKLGEQSFAKRQAKGAGLKPSGNGNAETYTVKERRNKRDVWSVTTKPYKGAHFATFPPDLVEPCILAGSREGDTVLDPFCGSGTVGMVCRRHNREFIGIELNEEYCEMAQKRIYSEE